MTPEQLQSWQPQATPSQLAQFIQENATLLQLLEETWAKFIKNAPIIVPSPTQYAPDVRPEDLTHHPISPEEMAHFQQQFERKAPSALANLTITEHDWQIEELGD